MTKTFHNLECFYFFVLYHLIIGIFGGLNFWFRDFLGFWFLPPFDHPCHKIRSTPAPSLDAYHVQNLETLLILRRSFEWYLRIFPNLSMSKVNANTKANVQGSKNSQIKMHAWSGITQLWDYGETAAVLIEDGAFALFSSPLGAFGSLSVPIQGEGNNNKKILMPARHQSRAYSFGISDFYLDICLGITQIYCLFILNTVRRP